MGSQSHRISTRQTSAAEHQLNTVIEHVNSNPIPQLFHGCAIAMGRTLSREQVIMAAQQAQAYHFIQELEHGFDTPLGEGGARLSVGQKQLVAIARALVAQPKILLLDEATSHIDSESEILVQAVLNQLKGKLTVVSVAHRLSTIRDADSIVVLNHGVIAEQGTHAQLLNIQSGIYSRLFELQTIELDQID